VGVSSCQADEEVHKEDICFIPINPLDLPFTMPNKCIKVVLLNDIGLHGLSISYEHLVHMIMVRFSLQDFCVMSDLLLGKTFQIDVAKMDDDDHTSRSATPVTVKAEQNSVSITYHCKDEHS